MARGRTLGILVVALLLAAPALGVAAGARTLDSTSRVGLGGVAIPVTFSPGLTGTTTLGANATYAKTVIPTAGTLISSTSLISINGGSSSHTTHIRLVHITGLSRVTEARVALATTDQVVIRNGEILQSSGLAVALLPGTSIHAGGDLEISKGHNAHMTLEVVSTATSGAQVVETWIMDLSG